MLIGAAILAVLAIFGSCWAYQMARDPKHWRLWWMEMLNVVEINASRERRRRQEVILVVCSYGLCAVCALIAIFGIYQAVLEVQELKRDKTVFEKEQELTRREFDAMRSKRSFQKLN